MQLLTAQAEDARIERGFSKLLERTAARIAAGERRLGWKVGINSPAVQQRLDLVGPVLGSLTSGTLRCDGTLSAPQSGPLLLEAELALRLGTVPSAKTAVPGSTLAIAAVAPALELLCIDGPLDDLAEVIARNSFHAGFALGTWTPASAVADTAAIALDLRIDDGRELALDPALLIGTATEIVRFAAQFLAVRDQRLAEGDILLCGALNPPAIVEPGRRVTATLVPAGTISCEIG